MMVRASLILAVLVSPTGACGDAAETPPPPSEQVSPSVSPTQPPPAPSEPDQPPGECDARDLGIDNFDCVHRALCSEVNRRDDAVNLVEFLCVVRELQPSGEEGVLVSDMLRQLPTRFRRNFTLRHGTERPGLRGEIHQIMAEVVTQRVARNSQVADLDFPRVMMWDEMTGLTIGFGGGLSAARGNSRDHMGADRLELHGFDRQTNRFELWAIDVPVSERDANGKWRLRPHRPEAHACARCHGPRSRPIWPMYPRWPGFYGDDNDELTGTPIHQRTERSWLRYFRHCIAEPGDKPDWCAAPLAEGRTALNGNAMELLDSRGRYSTLFAPELGDDRSLNLHPTFPYRPSQEEHGMEVSRAFTHRPNLRLGMLLNRAAARSLFEVIEQHPTYQQFRTLFAFELMACSWGDERGAEDAILRRFGEHVGLRLGERGMTLPAAAGSRFPIPYPVLLAAVDLSVRDVDLRFTHTSARYRPFDRAARQTPIVTSALDVGYVAYGPGDFNADNRVGSYFNSYFDGSATTNELLAGMVASDLAARDARYRDLVELRTLGQRVASSIVQSELDGPFCSEMDELAGWFPLPYPRRLLTELDRESFHLQVGDRQPLREQHVRMCDALRAALREAAPSN